MVAGMPIQGDGIPANTKILTVAGTTSLTLTKNATASSSSAIVQVNGLLSFQWRAGTPSNPGWTDFIIDQYEVINDGKSGMIRIYGVLPRLYDNMIRASYVAGFPVDWPNAGNGTTHQLPSEISNTVENLVVRAWKRRELAGKGSEALDGATTSWNKEIDDDDRAVINHWLRMPVRF